MHIILPAHKHACTHATQVGKEHILCDEDVVQIVKKIA
jgi:ribosome-interacting GTPase 1